MAEAQVGQRYKKIDAAWVTWTVIDIRVDLEGVRHCRIVNSNDRTNSKLIAERTLTDRKFYRLVAGA